MEPFPSSLEWSQSTDTRKQKRIIDWVSLSSMANSLPRSGESQDSGVSTPKRADTRSVTPSAAEYDSWEASVSMEEIAQLQRELVGSDYPVSETDGDGDDTGGTEALSGAEDDNNILLPLSHSGGPQARDLYRDRRSQTAPVGIPSHHPERPPRPPIRRNQTTSARIDALERAYNAVADDASQIPVVDLVHATGLVNRIQSALTEQITRRLGDQ
ncbi:hypothetical protein H0H81_003540 [Sphagnurus paluster]|uniref:Uncharacterized protein n=1 Tax=Sphagnurus paluster TaxID=117069 RepID=A0A9P7GLF7_9AGAR|nr:hypothetical protein H0H81_003540 [Sphagnurus paluster]